MGPNWILRASAPAMLALGLGLAPAACSSSSPMDTADGSTNAGGTGNSSGGGGNNSTTGPTGSGGTSNGGKGGGTAGSGGSVTTTGSGGGGGSGGSTAGAGGSPTGGAAGSGETGGNGTGGTGGSGGASGAKDAGNGNAGTGGSSRDAGGAGAGGSGGATGRDATSDVPAMVDVRNEPAACHAPATFMVTNQSTSAYVFDGNMSNPTFTLCRGSTYTFALNASGHPFYIKTAQVTGTGSTWDTGVSNNGASAGNIVFAVPANAPDTLFYQCSLHTPMTGTLHIVN